MAQQYVPIFFKNRLHLVGRPQMRSRPRTHDLKLLATSVHYLEVVQQWWSKYRGLNVANVGPRTTPP
jgi:hypothetical protein